MGTPRSRPCYRTRNETVVLQVIDGLVPMITSVTVSRGADELGLTVSVAVPPPPTDAGEKTYDVFAGQPVRVNATASEKPPDGVTVMV